MGRYGVSWVFRCGDRVVRRHLFSDKVETCIEGARIIAQNPNSSEVEVAEVSTGAPVDWRPARPWLVLVGDETDSPGYL